MHEALKKVPLKPLSSHSLIECPLCWAGFVIKELAVQCKQMCTQVWPCGRRTGKQDRIGHWFLPDSSLVVIGVGGGGCMKMTSPVSGFLRNLCGSGQPFHSTGPPHSQSPSWPGLGGLRSSLQFLRKEYCKGSMVESPLITILMTLRIAFP